MAYGDEQDVTIKVINEVMNLDRLRANREAIADLKKQVSDLSQEMVRNPTPQFEALLREAAESAAKLEAECQQLERSISAGNSKMGDAARLAQDMSRGFQDAVQGGLGGAVNNLEGMGASITKLTGLWPGLGTAMTVAGTAAVLLAQNWETIAGWFGKAPSEEFIGRLHRSAEAMKQLAEDAKKSADAYLELTAAEAKAREEKGFESTGRIDPKPDEIGAATGSAIKDYIARELGGSEGAVFGGARQLELRRFAEGFDEVRFDPDAVKAREAAELADRLAAQVERRDASGFYASDPTGGSRAMDVRQAEAARAESEKLGASLQITIKNAIDKMFSEATTLGEGSQGFARLKEFLGDRGGAIQGVANEAEAEARWKMAEPERKATEANIAETRKRQEEQAKADTKLDDEEKGIVRKRREDAEKAAKRAEEDRAKAELAAGNRAKADAAKNAESIRKELEKSEVEGPALELIERFRNSTFRNKQERAMVGGQIQAQIENAVRQSMVGRTDITPERAGEIARAAPEVYGKQLNRIREDARAAALQAGQRNTGQAEQRAVIADIQRAMGEMLKAQGMDAREHARQRQIAANQLRAAQQQVIHRNR